MPAGSNIWEKAWGIIVWVFTELSYFVRVSFEFRLDSSIATIGLCYFRRPDKDPFLSMSCFLSSKSTILSYCASFSFLWYFCLKIYFFWLIVRSFLLVKLLYCARILAWIEPKVKDLPFLIACSMKGWTILSLELDYFAKLTLKFTFFW